MSPTPTVTVRCHASDGWFDLLPWESRTVDVRWADAPVEGRRLRLHGWNVDVAID